MVGGEWCGVDAKQRAWDEENENKMSDGGHEAVITKRQSPASYFATM
jgi:hypothetical protein